MFSYSLIKKTLGSHPFLPISTERNSLFSKSTQTSRARENIVKLFTSLLCPLNNVQFIDVLWLIRSNDVVHFQSLWMNTEHKCNNYCTHLDCSADCLSQKFLEVLRCGELDAPLRGRTAPRRSPVPLEAYWPWELPHGHLQSCRVYKSQQLLLPPWSFWRYQRMTLLAPTFEMQPLSSGKY